MTINPEWEDIPLSKPAQHPGQGTLVSFQHGKTQGPGRLGRIGTRPPLPPPPPPPGSQGPPYEYPSKGPTHPTQAPPPHPVGVSGPVKIAPGEFSRVPFQGLRMQRPHVGPQAGEAVVGYMTARAEVSNCFKLLPCHSMYAPFFSAFLLCFCGVPFGLLAFLSVADQGIWSSATFAAACVSRPSCLKQTLSCCCSVSAAGGVLQV